MSRFIRLNTWDSICCKYFLLVFILFGTSKKENGGNPESSDSDGGVSYIKCGPMVLADIAIEKIHDLSKSQPVDQISQSAAEDKGKPKNHRPLMFLQPGEPVQQEQDSHNGCCDQKDETEFIAGLVPKSEGHTPVPDMYQVEKPFDDRNGFMDRYGTDNKGFRDLIQDDNDQGRERE